MNKSYSSARSGKAIALLSGGLDSSTVLFLAKRQGYRLHALIFDYGQRHGKEVQAAKQVARQAGVTYSIVRFRMPWGGSALLDRSMSLPKRDSAIKIGAGIPPTYVPARNTIFLSFALSCAEALSAGTIFIGANAMDYSGYPDCRPAYYKAFGKMSRLATKAGVEGKTIKIRVPLLRKTKAQIVRLALRLEVPLQQTWSCYAGGKKPCGKCDSCLLRAKGFRDASAKDPAIVQRQ